MKKFLIINNAEKGITEFTKPLEIVVTKARFRATLLEYKECCGKNLEIFSGIILSGSPQGDDIVEHHQRYFQWIKECKVPVLGICAGHHITGYLYGATYLKSKEPESGDFLIQTIKDDLIFHQMQNTFIAKQMHNDSITLPEDFELLATSTTCVNQLMKHKTKTIYTCQFHPEFYNHDLILNFLKICP